MFNINQLLSSDLSSFDPKDQEYILNFRENLKKELMSALVLNTSSKLLEALTEDRKEFINILSDILINGRKGYKDLPSTTLLAMYLEDNSTDDFIKLIDEVSEISK